jgi:hypothetical protein
MQTIGKVVDIAPGSGNGTPRTFSSFPMSFFLFFLDLWMCLFVCSLISTSPIGISTRHLAIEAFPSVYDVIPLKMSIPLS